jgi:lysophospholipase L1-like esterase
MPLVAVGALQEVADVTVAQARSGRAAGRGELALALSAMLALVMVVSRAAAVHAPLIVVLFLAVLLAVAGSWLNVALRRSDPADGWRRAVAELLLLTTGLVVAIAVGGSLALFGVSLSLVAESMLVSEWRRVQASRLAHVVLLLPLAVVALVAGALLPAGAAAVAIVAVGVLLGELGTELLSEDSHCWDRKAFEDPRWRWPCAVVAVLSAVAAFVLLVFPGNMSPVHFVLLLGGLGVVVWVASSDSDALALVMVAVLAVVVASTPDEQALPDGVTAVPDEPYFLALGDSYISGEGADAFVPGTNDRADNEERTNECRQAPTAWPVRLAESPPEGLPSRVLFLACSGAVTENIDVEDRIVNGTQSGPAELAQFVERRDELGDPEFVLLSVGGNDAGFSRIGKTCVGPGSCAAVAQQFVDDDEPGPSDEDPDAAEDLASIRDDLLETYRRVGDVLPGVPVIVVPYPRPITKEGSCDVLLDKSERAFIVRFVNELNGIIEETATSRKFLYMDTMEESVTPLCSDGISSGLNFLALSPKVGSEAAALWPPNWFHNSFHPNAEGHAAMFRAAVRWFDAHELTEAPGAGPVYEAPVLSDLYGDAPPDQCSTESDLDCEVDGGRWLSSRIYQTYRLVLAPVAVLTIGWWLLLTPLRRRGRDSGFSLVGLLRLRSDDPRTARPPGDPGGRSDR